MRTTTRTVQLPVLVYGYTGLPRMQKLGFEMATLHSTAIVSGAIRLASMPSSSTHISNEADIMEFADLDHAANAQKRQAGHVNGSFT